MTSSRTAHQSSYRGLCDTAYETDLVFKKYSFKDMAHVMEDFYEKAIKEGAGERELYLLRLRIDYLLTEVNAQHSDLVQALISLYSISPYIVKEIVSSKAVNVFLARDAAREYVTASLMQRLKGLRCKIHIVHISRKNLRAVYKLVSRQKTNLQRGKIGQALLERELLEAYRSDPAVREEVQGIETLLKDAGLLDKSRIRFIDTWTSGSIFVSLSLVIGICDRYELGTADLLKKRSPRQRKLEFATANNKKSVHVVETIYDYENVAQGFSEWWALPKSFYSDYSSSRQNILPITSFDCSSISEKTVDSWYRFYGFARSRSIVVRELCELASAQIFKKFNHFGSLNLGHPIEWDNRTRCAVSTASYKRIGNLFRTMFLINAVIGYYEDYKSPLLQKPQSLPSSRERMRRLRAWHPSISPASFKCFDKVLMASNEHVVTCEKSITYNLLKNIQTIIAVFGCTSVARMTPLQNYNFQFFINQTKRIENKEFLRRLRYLKEIYGLRVLKTMFFQSSFYFEKEVQQALSLHEHTRQKPASIVFDIDGTLTPIETGVTVVRECARAGIEPIFITGRPTSFCLKFTHSIISGSSRELRQTLQSMQFYASNGAESFIGMEKVLRTREVITRRARAIVLRVCKSYGLATVSERDYRIVVSSKESSVECNPNLILAARDDIERVAAPYGLGVYMINWNSPSTTASFYNSIDICASNKGRALTHVLISRSKHEVLVIGDDPHNSDKDILKEHGISVQGYGVMKTLAIVRYISRRKVSRR